MTSFFFIDMANYYTTYQEVPVESANNVKKILIHSGIKQTRENASIQLFQRQPYPKRRLVNIKVRNKGLGNLIKTIDHANGLFPPWDYTQGDVTLPLVANKPVEVEIVARRTAPPWMYSVKSVVTFIESELKQAAPIKELNGLLMKHAQF